MEYTPAKLDVNVDAAGVVVDMDSLYVALSRLADRRPQPGVRYAPVTVLVLIVLAKLSGEDRLCGIAEWVRHPAKSPMSTPVKCVIFGFEAADRLSEGMTCSRHTAAHLLRIASTDLTD